MEARAKKERGSAAASNRWGGGVQSIRDSQICGCCGCYWCIVDDGQCVLKGVFCHDALCLMCVCV